MLATMLMVMYLVGRTVERLGVRWTRPDAVPYMVSQPLPWQVQYVSQNRRGSRVDEADGQTQWRRNSRGLCQQSWSPDNGQSASASSHSPDKAAATIQTQYRKYQQRKQKDSK
ncbi:hypothetical protein AGOR_G00031690 [Albula goreensis]|uniref:Secreted protein n=1 Tax=Albula goreensis TaxID=1534307 RepID=A0A8T3E3L6_9TELE|nr:hypothetical protein AGOR_G00031690 [Albula goreensis]